MTTICFDTETTGLISFKLPLSDESQPRILSLAAILCNENGEIVESMDTLIHHPGLEIPEFITKINGITQADCEARGIPIVEALARYNEMKAKSHTRLAHNLSFDKQMIARETLAAGQEHLPYAGESFCTVKMCKTLGHPGKLGDAYRSIFGREMENAHTAMGDALACKEIFFKLRVV